MSKIVGWPRCNLFKKVGNNTVAYICPSCRKCVSIEEILLEEDMNKDSRFISVGGNIDKERAALVGKAREEAYDWKRDVVEGKIPFYDVVDGKQVQ